MNEDFPLANEQLAAFCRKHHIVKLSLFGSTLHDKAKPTSDVDLLVEFEPGHEPGFIALAGMELELSQQLGGKKVDMRTALDLSPYFREQVVQHAELRYAA